MGGNALKNTQTERKCRIEYWDITGFVCQGLREIFPGVRLTPVIAYSLKESFGDSDILLASDNLPPDWKQQVIAKFTPHEVVNNGGVMSFDVMGMQIDIITVPDKELHMASTYFAFNDLGNLMGRIAQKMGFKYGSNGLWKPLFEGDQKYAEIHVSQGPSAIFSFLGYDWARFTQGFDTIEDIFRYAASTPFFHGEIFLLENRNNYSRTRDAKRPTYTAFLKWLEDKPELNIYPWSSFGQTSDMVDNKAKLLRQEEKWEMMLRAEKMFPNLSTQVTEANDKHSRMKMVKAIFNGNIVSKITGYQGKELGTFITFCRNHREDFDDYVLSYPHLVPDMIMAQYELFKQSQ